MQAERQRFRRAQAITAIDQYLTAADLCIKTVVDEATGKVLGYPAALLLLCATDAIGHGVLPPNGEFTRLDVLADWRFGSALNHDQATLVTKWYRHLLAHNATMAFGVSLVPDAEGEPFEFEQRVLIRLGKRHEIVSTAWSRTDKATFNPPEATGPQPDLAALAPAPCPPSVPLPRAA